jgi:hypothetical protein
LKSTELAKHAFLPLRQVVSCKNKTHAKAPQTDQYVSAKLQNLMPRIIAAGAAARAILPLRIAGGRTQ